MAAKEPKVDDFSEQPEAARAVIGAILEGGAYRTPSVRKILDSGESEAVVQSALELFLGALSDPDSTARDPKVALATAVQAHA